MGLSTCILSSKVATHQELSGGPSMMGPPDSSTESRQGPALGFVLFSANLSSHHPLSRLLWKLLPSHPIIGRTALGRAAKVQHTCCMVSCWLRAVHPARVPF